MSDRPDISVVMSVYNGESHLRETIDSILNQQGVSLEFIIVNDGSTDQSPHLLNEYARQDTRLRIIHQENQGLTKALVVGCAAAQGHYIARQDIGDISLPNRLRLQINYIKKSSDVAFVSCGTRYIGPGGEYLYDVTRDPADATKRLLSLDLYDIQGPSSHPSTFFSRKLYQQVGGYRSAFYFAQDLDLWIRMAEVGQHLVMPEILYQAAISVNSISGLYRQEQVATARLILRSAQLRREGADDNRILEQAQAIKPSRKRMASRLVRSRAYYFIGRCLEKNHDQQALTYFKSALLTYPLHIKAAMRLLLG